MLAAVRRVARWMADQGAPVRPDLFDGLAGFDPGNNRRHARREISPEELARLIDTTRGSEDGIRDLAGAARAMLYLTAFATGYRPGNWRNSVPNTSTLTPRFPPPSCLAS